MEPPNRSATDRALLDSFIQDGREESFDALLQRYKLKLLNLAFRVLYDRHAAEDVVQNVFIRLVQRKDELINLQSAQSWLYATTVYLSLNMQRTKRRMKKREQAAEGWTCPETPRQAAMRAEARKQLDVALASLKHSLRIPVVLRYLQGLSYGEAAEVLDLSSDAVRMRVKQGLRVLRKRLTARGLVIPIVAVEAGLRSLPAKAASASFLTSASSIIKAASTAGIAAKVAATTTSVINGGLIVTAKTKIAIGVGAAILLGGALIYFVPKGTDRSRTTAPRAERPTLRPKDDSVAESERKEDLPPGPAPEISEQPDEVKDFDIAGKVVDKAGKPLEGAQVGANLFAPPRIVRTYTTEGGKFGFRCPDEKEYILFVSKEDYVPVQKRFSRPKKDIVVTMLLGGAIEGKVVDAVTNEPLDLFRIKRSRYDASFEHLRDNTIYLPQQGKAFWNPEGKFRVSGLETGTYTLFSMAEGYAQSSAEGIKVELEKTTTGVVIQQQPAGGIYGRVVDAIGRPIEGAKIVQKTRMAVFEMYADALTTSDAKGEFEIGGLPSGTFTLEARHGDYGPAERTVDVIKGEITQGVEFQLLEGASISGTVVAEADLQPIAGVTVRLRVGPRDPDAFTPFFGGTVNETDPKGHFQFTKLKSGTYFLTVSAPDFPDETMDDVMLEENEAVEDLIIKLSQGGSLVGTVRDHTGKPVADAHVGAASALMQKGAKGDEEGNYAITGLKQGKYLVNASHARTAARGIDSENYYVQIEEGKETRLDIVVGGSLKVYGKVTSGGEPQPGLEILFLSSTKTVAGTNRYLQREVHTDADGYYEIGNLKPGGYTLIVVSVPLLTEILLANADVEKNFELPEGSVTGRVVDAETGKPIEGAKVALQPRRVTSLWEARSLKSAGFRFRPPSDKTDSEGRYSLSAVEDGVYFVVASKEGYAPQGTTAEVENSQGPSDLDFFLSTGTTLQGSVTGSDPSRPVQEIFLSARASNGAIVYAKNINLTPEGGYETAALTPGEYTISVEAKGYAPATKKVSVVAGGDNRADFVLPAGGTLIVRAIDDRGYPVPGAQTKVLDEEGNYWLPAFRPDAEDTEEEGVTITPNLSTGEYRVTVSALGYEDESLNVTIREGDTAERTVRLRKSR